MKQQATSVTQSQLLAETAHELRRPLSNIKGFVSTLRRSDVTWDDDIRTKYLAEIEVETDRLAHLVDSLLASRATDGRDSQREIMVDVPRSLPRTWIDADGVERVVANLVENAIKYSPAGTPILPSGRLTDDSELVLEVEDEGRGANR